MRDAPPPTPPSPWSAAARPRFVLASASPARLRLLRAAGLDPEVVVSGVPEDDVGGLPAAEAVAVLAERKAVAVASRLAGGGRPGVVVLGCDSLLELDGAAQGKPVDAADALERWQRMRGRSGVLHTGHCLVAGERRESGVVSTVVRFADPTDAELAAYIATGEPLAVAGAFTLDGRGAPFVVGIDGDPGAVIGVSLPLVRVLLARVGVAITDLWA
jgi:septum formation protein